MLNPKEEREFKRLKALCIKLHVPSPPEIMIGLKVHDKNGVLIFDDVQRGHSWTRNFYNLIYGVATDHQGGEETLFGAGYMSGKETDGDVHGSSIYGCSRNAGQLMADTGFSNATVTDTYGVLVGTGDTAFNADQYDLVAKIAAGTGAGQFSHVAQTHGTGAYNVGTTTWKETIARIFNNNSGGSITVKEVGLGWYGFIYYPAGGHYYLLERSVLSPTVPVPNGAQLTVTYEISMDFSAID